MAPTWPVIRTPKEVYGVSSEAAYVKAHRKQIAGLQKRGLPVQEHIRTDSVPAIVSAGVWLVVCDCGGGVAAGPGWSSARCFDCGAVYTAVQWPENLEAITHALLSRPTAARHWWGDADSHARIARILGASWVRTYGKLEGETVDDLHADNRMYAPRAE